MAPPENSLRMKKCFAMTGIPAAQGTLPEASDHFLPGNITPAMLNVSLIGNFIQHDRLSEFSPPFVRIFGCPVQILTLNTAVGNPRAGMIIHLQTLMNRTQMAIRIIPAHQVSVKLPILFCFCWQKVIFIGCRPPYVPICRKTCQHIFPVQFVSFPWHG